MDATLGQEAAIERTEWGGWLARTPPEHRFRLAAVGRDRDAVVRDLVEAVEAWNRLAASPRSVAGR